MLASTLHPAIHQMRVLCFHTTALLVLHSVYYTSLTRTLSCHTRFTAALTFNCPCRSDRQCQPAILTPSPTTRSVMRKWRTFALTCSPGIALIDVDYHGEAIRHHTALQTNKSSNNHNYLVAAPHNPHPTLSRVTSPHSRRPLPPHPAASDRSHHRQPHSLPPHQPPQLLLVRCVCQSVHTAYG